MAHPPRATHIVHIYHTVRSSFAVTADSDEEAIRQADALFPRAPIPAKPITPTYDVVGYLGTEDAEEVTARLIDHADDDEFANSVFLEEASISSEAGEFHA